MTLVSAGDWFVNSELFLIIKGWVELLFGKLNPIQTTLNTIVTFFNELNADIKSLFDYFSVSNDLFTEIVNMMPTVVKMCAVVVVGISVVKLIFGR